MMTPTERPITLWPHEVRGLLDGSITQLRRVLTLPVPEDADEVFYWQRPSNIPASQCAPAGFWARKHNGPDSGLRHVGPCGFGDIGDRLWGRETFWDDDRVWHQTPHEIIFAATPEWAIDHTGKLVRCECPDGHRPSREDCERNVSTHPHWHRKSSTHMPRWASRLLLSITDIRIQRVQDISEDDIQAQGEESCMHHPECRFFGTTHIGYRHVYDESGYSVDGEPDCECGDFSHRELFALFWDSINADRGKCKTCRGHGIVPAWSGSLAGNSLAADTKDCPDCNGNPGGHSWADNPRVVALTVERIEEAQ